MAYAKFKSSAEYTLSNGDLTAERTGGTDGTFALISTDSIISSGKVYFEVEVLNESAEGYFDEVRCGISDQDNTNIHPRSAVGVTSGSIYEYGVSVDGIPDATGSTSIIGLAIDASSGVGYVSIDGDWYGADPPAGTGSYLWATAPIVPESSISNFGIKILLVSDPANLTYPAPTGFTAGLESTVNLLTAVFGVGAEVHLIGAIECIVNADIGLSADIERIGGTDNVNCTIGIGVDISADTTPVFSNAVIGLSCTLFADTTPISVNADIGLSSTIAANSTKNLVVGSGIGLRASVVVSPFVLFEMEAAIGIRAALKLAGPSSLMVNSLIGISTAMSGDISHDLALDVSVGVGSSVFIDNGSPAIPCRLPKFSESRWC